jgi:hypothetical protein
MNVSWPILLRFPHYCNETPISSFLRLRGPPFSIFSLFEERFCVISAGMPRFIPVGRIPHVFAEKF